MSPVIARVWRGKAQAATADAYVGHLQTVVFPELREMDGFKSAHVLRRDDADGVTFVVMTLWASREAIQRFAGEDLERAVVPPEAQALLDEWQERVEHYEVVATGDGGAG